MLWAGAAAALWYTTVVLIGALATPGYSHIGEHVSTLYQSGAPNGTWIILARWQPVSRKQTRAASVRT
jgi:hypothetical protein